MKTTATIGLALAALSPVWAQDAPAPPAPPTPPATTDQGPGPATQPPAAPGTTQPGPTQPAATPPPNYKIQYNGLIDGYLQYSLQNPHGTQLGVNGATGAYNASIKTPTLQLAELNVFNNPKPGGFAFKTTLIAGATADQNHANYNAQTGGANGGTSEAQFKNIQQLYGTYAFAGAGGGIDIGKFYTPFGYEVTEANGNYNYTRSLPYNLLPIYHAGIRAYTPSFKGLVVTGYVVNDIFNTATEGVHHQGNYGGIGQLNYTDPKGKFTAIGTLGFGKDMLGVKTKVTVNDDDFTYNLNAKQLVGLNYTYVQLKPDDSTPKTTANGYAAYYRQQLTPKTAAALRFSGYSAKTDGTSAFGSSTLRPYEVTLTYEYKAAANLTTRLEYRHDNSNQDDYLGDNDSTYTGPTKKNEDLLLLAGMFTF
jgi:hypothetical protein